MKLVKNEDETFTLTDETGASIAIEDTDELLDAYLELGVALRKLSPAAK